MLPDTLVFAALIVGTYASFLLWGYYQEKVMAYPYYTEYNHREYFHYPVFLNMVQAATACALALAYIQAMRVGLIRFRGKGLARLMGVSLSHSLASPFGYIGLKYVNYPTYILAKSCKLLPVVVMQALLYRRRFAASKLVAIALITAGVVLFTLLKSADNKNAHRSNSLFGLAMILINLALDGVSNATQDALAAMYSKKAISWNLMFYINLVSLAYMSLYVLVLRRDELTGALLFLDRHPPVLFNIAMFSVTGAVGQIFIYQLLEGYGSLVLVTVTLTRKLFSVILSNIMYQHGINARQWLSVGLVFVGIYLESTFKGRGPSPHQPHPKQA